MGKRWDGLYHKTEIIHGPVRLQGTHVGTKHLMRGGGPCRDEHGVDARAQFVLQGIPLLWFLELVFHRKLVLEKPG